VLAPSERRAYVEDDAEEEPEEAVGEEREDGVERRGEGDMREGEVHSQQREEDGE
jgi:hypothetical protein